jgi:hypothetical protein
MTSICVQTIEMGSVSACPVQDLDPETKEGDRYISLILAHPSADKCLRLMLSPRAGELLGEALALMGKELKGQAL